MAFQSEPITTTDVLNYVGEAFFYGQKFGKAPLLGLRGLLTGFKVATGTQFVMGNLITGDDPSQATQTEDASIATMTDTNVGSADQKTNYLQQYRKTYTISYAAQALAGAISGVALLGGAQTIMRAMPLQREAQLKQFISDFEYSALYGTAQAWTNAATAGAMGGILTAIEAGSETAASGATLSKTLIETEIARMAVAGAEFADTIIMGNVHQIQVLNSIYGNAIQSSSRGGLDIQTVQLPILGESMVVYNPQMDTDHFAVIDMAHFSPVFGIVPGKPPVFTEPLAKIAAGDQEQLFSMISVDYTDILYHGMITGLATS